MLSACGSAINVQLPGADGTGGSVSVGEPTAAPVATGLSNTTLIYLVIGLVGVVVLIALIAVIGSRNKSNN